MVEREAPSDGFGSLPKRIEGQRVLDEEQGLGQDQGMYRGETNKPELHVHQTKAPGRSRRFLDNRILLLSQFTLKFSRGAPLEEPRDWFPGLSKETRHALIRIFSDEPGTK
ncbi:hypothetical protein A3H87_03710 [Candidatus Curtissbacteria bacterium RIFCSPLOWO2_02_FULL_42_37]|uniref:Uncharacterized protein n=1 Tax=Candidatus Curtissbacteria bacterium RIFCSPLOWO2_01_FULL_42_50 TaxID=1797730 RepID=A0A1F5H2N2_9BACT|nr:MAG: hypothetical protein A3E71_02210 [Candidatus Curtissbacteria bacterium RIFCSPHIGHO2_12_FULL_42_33]OGD98361.1 MAG: hypothetical protein A3B54_00730 [Candidatus Curtissbacteria bacterium RIFCSPLOWO2_01_FULL_42_50]OGE10771.1 MAG: hypothetical protein A3H87_03710 [Candidatus Curtissbacteria bacterium RIFCSPLOWO2_02_FULL_42_37]